MQTRPQDMQWFDSLDGPELARRSGMTTDDLDELVEYGTLVPSEAAGARVFSASAVPPLQEAVRLRADFDLDLFTTSLLFGYLQRIASLEHQLRGLQAPPSHPQLLPREGPAPWHEPHA